MLFILLILSSLGYVYFVHAYGKQSLITSPFIVISAIILLLYVFAISNVLFAGAVSCLVAGLILGGVSLWRKPEVVIRRYDLHDLWAVLYAAPFVVFYHAIPNNYQFMVWDEFTFWGLSIKILALTDALYNADMPTHYNHYPPAQQLFQYYIIKFTSWSESNALYAQIAFILSANLFLVGNYFRKHNALSVIVFWVSCGFLYFFKYEYASIYSDQLLAMYFCAAMSFAFTSNSKPINVLKLCILLAVLVLLKEIGLILALLVLVVFVVNNTRVGTQESASLLVRLRCFQYVHPLIVVLVGVFSLYAVFKSWQIHVVSINAKRDFTIPPLVDFFQGARLELLGASVTESIRRLSAPDFIAVNTKIFTHSFSLVQIIELLLVGSVLVIFLYKKEHRCKLAGSFLLVFTGCIGFILFLLFSYQLFFTYWESITLASFERYAGTYCLAWASLLYVMFCAALIGVQRKWATILGVILSIGLCILMPMKFYQHMASMHSDYYMQILKPMSALQNQVKSHVKENEKVYFIHQHSMGYEHFAFYYAIYPIQTQWWCWSIVNEEINEPTSCKERTFAEYVLDYDYVAINGADEVFWRTNDYLFEKTAEKNIPTLFKVEKNNGTVVRLVEIK